jgi:hypothetical protein
MKGRPHEPTVDCGVGALDSDGPGEDVGDRHDERAVVAVDEITDVLDARSPSREGQCDPEGKGAVFRPRAIPRARSDIANWLNEEPST